MTSSFVIILDNGYSYSDHEHRPVLVVDTEEQAKELVQAWNAWHRRCASVVAQAKEEDFLILRWADVDLPDPPFGPPHGDWSSVADAYAYDRETNVWYLEVPKELHHG